MIRRLAIVIVLLAGCLPTAAQIQPGPNLSPSGRPFLFAPRAGYLGPPAAIFPLPYGPPPLAYGPPGPPPVAYGPPPGELAAVMVIAASAIIARERGQAHAVRILDAAATVLPPRPAARLPPS
jgi:hypothetical protein